MTNEIDAVAFSHVWVDAWNRRDVEAVRKLFQAQALIDQALKASERALSEGNGRQAVQEVLRRLNVDAFRPSMRAAREKFPASAEAVS